MGCGKSKDAAAANEPTNPVPSKPAGGGGAPAAAVNSGEKLILNRYRMHMDQKMGEGSFCMCYKGTDVKTDAEVAIKVYKVKADKPKEKKVCLMKFKRQIQVLQDLGTPLDKSKVPEPGLWSKALDKVSPLDVFIQLLDYSKDASGQPGDDPVDQKSYVVTELAEYSMKDYLADLREKQETLDRNRVQFMTRSTCMVIAALHAKGLAHLDIKPENLMFMSGKWKLIDVDGCVKIGTKVSITDASISFSPVYCAPEWARFLIEDQEKIKIQAALDVWSVGITICEFASLDAILKGKFVSYLKKGCNHREAGFHFMDWLSNASEIPLPSKVMDFDPMYVALIRNRLLVPDFKKRANLCDCIDDPFLEGVEVTASGGLPQARAALTRKIRLRAHADDSAPPGVCNSLLWKLNVDGDLKDPEHWLKRDMWLAQNGNLCYFSKKENKRLVYLDRSKLIQAQIKVLSPSDGAARDNAFEVACKGEGGEFESVYFACDTKAEQKKWTTAIMNIQTNEGDWVEPKTMMATHNFMKEMRKMRLKVNNRRAELSGDVDPFLPVFKKNLWKLKQDGDAKLKEHWFQREMWISKNGSLCYYSKKQEKNLIYYNHSDLDAAEFREAPTVQAAMGNLFEVVLAPVDGCDFEPGLFATDSPEDLKAWIKELWKVSGREPE